MKSTWRALLSATVLLFPAPALAQEGPGAAVLARAEDLREEIRAMVQSAKARVFPALVNIHVISVEYWGGKENKSESVGSGTIVTPDGHILTNAHVTNRGKRFRVRMADQAEVHADLVGEDVLTDLAVLKIDPADLADPSSLPVAAVGDSSIVRVGDTVLAMGSPFALSRSVTLGIVSNTERVFASAFSGDRDAVDAMQEERGERSGLFTRWIQHDALILPGNSGGPLVNLKGEVVGVNTLGGNGMGFASPSNLAREVMAALIEHGSVPRSWIGATFKPIERTTAERGVLLTSIVAGGPADRAGLKPGDVVTALDGEAVNVRFAEQIPALLKRFADTPIGGAVRVAYVRGEGEGEARLVTEALLKDRGQRTLLRAWGVSIEEITDKLARDRRLDSKEGALVSGVRAGSPAALAEPALTWGDVIRSIDGTPVASIDALVEAYRSGMARADLPEYFLIEFDRQGKNQLTLVKSRPDKPQDPPRELPKAWIGVATQPVGPDLARQLGHEQATGFRVTRVYPGTLAASSGLSVGDVITAIDGEALKVRGMQDAGIFNRRVRGLKIDQTARLDVWRAGGALEIPVALERTRIGTEEARRDTNRDFELAVRELTFFDRDDNRWDDSVRGVIVLSAESGGWASLAGLSPGDLIQRIGDRQTPDLETYRAVMDDLTRAQPRLVEFVVVRNNRTFFNYAEPEWKPRTEAEEKADEAHPPK
ncbi:MAG: PDZ domain-containing protein [Phycisphaerae bacterium]|nr:PDZ domain-containing protein [Phycisphaerae bacterium]